MVAIAQNDLTAAQCARRLDYNPISGTLVWILPISNRQATVGDEAGLLHKDGYRYLTINRRMRLAHRIAWLMTYGEWPAGYVDHKNRIRSDNRLCNLRLATPSESSRNTSSRRGSSSQFLGVTKNPFGWQAGIRLPGRRSLYLGTFPTEQAAADAYVAASKEHFGDFAGGA